MKRAVCYFFGHRSTKWEHVRNVETYDDFGRLPYQRHAVYVAACDRCCEPISKRVKV